jgi:hypothetical protein
MRMRAKRDSKLRDVMGGHEFEIEAECEGEEVTGSCPNDECSTSWVVVLNNSIETLE